MTTLKQDRICLREMTLVPCSLMLICTDSHTFPYFTWHPSNERQSDIPVQPQWSIEKNAPILQRISMKWLNVPQKIHTNMQNLALRRELLAVHDELVHYHFHVTYRITPNSRAGRGNMGLGGAAIRDQLVQCIPWSITWVSIALHWELGYCFME